MNSNTRVVCLISLFSLLIVGPTWAVVDTHDVDAVREKRVLDERDLTIIDSFMQDAIQELVYTRDFSSIAKTRSIVLTRRTASAQYNQQFSDSAHKYISQGFVLAQELEPERRNRVYTNLLILIHGLADSHLTDIALDWTVAESEPVSFWAVRALTNSAVVDVINDGSEAALSQRVMEQLQQVVATGNENTLTLIISFIGELKSDAGSDLLKALITQREQVYENGSVKAPLLDGQFLRLLSERIQRNGDDRLEYGPGFCQLYSYVIQTFIKGQGVLSDAVLQDLAAVIVDVEDRCLKTLMEKPQTTFKRAVDSSDLDAIQVEHDRLLGTAAGRGELGKMLQISYGSLMDGRERTQPKQLSRP